MFLNTNTNAEYVRCLPGGTDSDLKSSENFAQNQKCTQSGLLCKMTSLSSGELEIGVSGALGYEITETTFHDKGWE